MLTWSGAKEEKLYDEVRMQLISVAYMYLSQLHPFQYTQIMVRTAPRIRYD